MEENQLTTKLTAVFQLNETRQLLAFIKFKKYKRNQRI
jgi:hypothetical protein